ncbi:MAG TPA: TonB-dependent receptor [Allosphingosinicella sp.]
MKRISPLACTVSTGAMIVAALAAAPAFAATGQAQNPVLLTGALQAQPLPNASTPAGQAAQAAQPADTAEPGSETVAEEAAPTGDAAASDPNEEIVVTGFRASLQNALSQKRRSDQIIDAITAEDIADFPDANLAESIQRLPGVSIDRDNGEGRSVTIRGLGGDFQMTRLNGADALSVAGGNSSDAGANRTRGFDFNTFASELFSNIKVTKTTAAVNDEGSLGAIIDLTTGRPLAYKENRFLVGAEGEYRENGSTWNPRLTGLASIRIADNFGILASVAYQEQRQQIDRYQRGIGSFEYLYRNSQIPGVTPPAFGFARPGGTGPTFGSNPAAAALLSPTTIIPALPSIGRQDLSYDRLGATATAQWRPTSRTEIVLDGVYSRYRQDSTQNAITPIGLNRNFPTGTGGANPRFLQTGTAGIRALRNANGTLNQNGVNDRIGSVNATTGAITAGLFPACRVQFAECGQTAAGGVLLPGTINSYNPRNRDVFDYYNSPTSPGFIPSTDNLAGFVPLIGRTNTKVREAHVNEAGQADYLLLDDVDWRSSADAQFGETNFYQGTLNVTQEFGDRLSADATIGYSRSEFRGVGLLAEFNSLDRDNYVFDERDGGDMPVFSPGFDPSDPNQWTLVKGLSAIRYITTRVDNEFRVARLNFAYEANDELTIRWGGTFKQFDFASNQERRSQDIEAINPTLQEANLAITDLGKTVGFGQGLNVSEGTPTSIFVPDLNAFRREFGIDCNCVNEWGDFRVVPDGRNNNAVRERDMSAFFQLDFDMELFGRPLRGNAGLRVARTQVTGRGRVGATDGEAGIPVTARNTYYDFLPALNANWEATENFLVRFAASQTISRPQLSALTPGTTSFPNITGALNNAGAAPTITVGNPYLKPFRSSNFDLSFERYFGRSGLVGVTLFYKNLESFPQQVAAEVPLQSVFEPAIYEQLLAQFTNAQFRDYIAAGGVFGVRQFQDAPGGTIKGFEVNVQTDFGFIAPAFENFGITANYTHIDSKLTYLTNTVLNTRRGQASGTAANSFATGPFLNTSPDAFNATVYYEDKRFSARVSTAYRERYVNRFPLAAGTCSPGITTNAGGPCNSPVIADFGYTENTLNVDFATSYNLTDWVRLTFEARNLTNETTRRTMYEANPVSQLYQSTGRVFTAGARVTF